MQEKQFYFAEVSTGCEECSHSAESFRLVMGMSERALCPRCALSYNKSMYGHPGRIEQQLLEISEISLDTHSEALIFEVGSLTLVLPVHIDSWRITSKADETLGWEYYITSTNTFTVYSDNDDPNPTIWEATTFCRSRFSTDTTSETQYVEVEAEDLRSETPPVESEDLLKKVA